MADEEDTELGVPQAAAAIGVSEATLNRAARLGTLRARKVGRNWITTLSAARTWKDTEEFHRTGPKNKHSNA